jgi:hypothetical protein
MANPRPNETLRTGATGKSLAELEADSDNVTDAAIQRMRARAYEVRRDGPRR